MLFDERLVPEVMSGKWSYDQSQIAESANKVYVACTRARRELVLGPISSRWLSKPPQAKQRQGTATLLATVLKRASEAPPPRPSERDFRAIEEAYGGYCGEDDDYEDDDDGYGWRYRYIPCGFDQEFDHYEDGFQGGFAYEDDFGFGFGYEEEY